jgi:acetyl esterase/lipase
MTLENCKVRNRMDSNNRPALLLDKSLQQWSLAATCPIVEYDLYIPYGRPHLLKEWDILTVDPMKENNNNNNDDIENKRMLQQDDILVKVRFPSCLLDDNDDDGKNDNHDNTNNKNDGHVLRPASGSIIHLSRILQQHPHVPVVLHFHGGGLVMGNASDTVGIDLVRGVCSLERMLQHASVAASSSSSSSSSSTGDDDEKKKKKKKNASTVAAMILFDIEYSLAPEHAFPVAVVQGLTVLHHLLQGEELKCNSNKIHITGVSAGGLLAAVTTLQGLRRFPNNNNRIASGIFLCPMLDPACQSDSFVQNEMASWLVPTAWLRWCWQVYLLYHQPPTTTNEKNNEKEHGNRNQTTTNTTTTTPTTTTSSSSSASSAYCWWQQHRNSKLAPFMSPLWDDFQDLVVEAKNNKKRNLSTASSSWPRFVITTNRGDPLHDDGVALIEKLRTAVAAVSLVVGDDNDDHNKKHQHDGDDDNMSRAAAVVVQHLDHDGTHWLGTFLDSQSYQELIRACKDSFFPS